MNTRLGVASSGRSETKRRSWRCPDRVVFSLHRERCFVDTEKWVELGPSGRVESYTIVQHKLGAGPEAPLRAGVRPA
jgi:uncharacterized OB-fold protein